MKLSVKNSHTLTNGRTTPGKGQAVFFVCKKSFLCQLQVSQEAVKVISRRRDGREASGSRTERMLPSGRENVPSEFISIKQVFPEIM